MAAAAADRKALKEIVSAYNDVKNKERILKDARGEHLGNSKDAMGEVDTAIKEAEAASDGPEATSKLGTVIVCWNAYKATKAEGAEMVKAAKEDLTEAEKRLATAVEDSKQGKLELD